MAKERLFKDIAEFDELSKKGSGFEEVAENIAERTSRRNHTHHESGKFQSKSKGHHVPFKSTFGKD